MARVKPTDETPQSFRERFPMSLVGSWSTFGDGYQMEYGHTATFHRDGTGVFEIWGIFEEDEEQEQTWPFYWTAKDGFEVEVRPAPSVEPILESDWGSFVVEFYIAEDGYGNKSIAICDARGREGGEPFWWFSDSIRHPMRLLDSGE